MTGAEKLKSLCFKCKINKWAVDFKEGSYSKLSSTSVCLSCQQGELIAAQKKEIDLLKAKNTEYTNKIKKLEDSIKKIETALKGGVKNQTGNEASSKNQPTNMDEKIKALENAVKEDRDEIVETGKQVVEIRNEISWIKTNGKKSTKGKQEQQSITLSNRFEALDDEVSDSVEPEETEIDSYVIGDSIVREQVYHFAMRNNRQRKSRIVKSYSGCKAKKVVEEVNSIDTKNKNVCIIANADGNDLYKKGNKVGNSEPLLEDLKSLVNSVANKTSRGILMGILPRRYASYYATSKAIALNERISEFCQKKKVDFVDPWKMFYGKWQFFRSDGIHLNERGHRKLGEILWQAYDRRMYVEHQLPNPPQPSPVVCEESGGEDNEFEGFPNE